VSDGLALYVHWPFCVRKCPYCDFNSHVRAEIDADRFGRALLADLAHEAAHTPGRTLTSLFFGGGTPSLMPPAIAAAVIDAALRLWPADPGLEVTLEANPSSVEAARFAALAAAGVNRLSLGLQALDDDALRLLGRPHDLREGLAALDLAQKLFPRVSIDLIHSRPGQTVAAWERELGRALCLGTGHLSAYQLTIEPGTRFQTLHATGRLQLPDEDTAALLFERTGQMCDAAGLPAYEISNHARPGDESRHNLSYWRYGEYVGIGPGAHGRRREDGGRVGTVRYRRPEHWAGAVERVGHGIESEDRIERATAAAEAVLMGLRLSEGLDDSRFRSATGVALADAIDPAARARMVGLGLVVGGDSLQLTAAGRLLLDPIVAALTADLKHAADVAS
jgi:oxygen-independent coproporphyrinogen-3 oxidase